MSQDYSYRNPVLSLWQASVVEVHRRRQSVQSRIAQATTENIVPVGTIKVDELMAPAQLIAEQVAQAPSPADVLAVPKATGIAAKVTDAADCGKLAAQFLWAEMSGNQAKAKELAGELKFSVCDGTGWAECVTTFLAYKALHATLPYRPNKDVMIDLGKKSTIAILGDWGTGDAVAINVLQQAAAFKPEILIHLGDVYYACTQSEAHNNFLDICRVVLGDDVPVYSLCGNHDMYSGGAGYYWLVDRLGQQASYFCLQNDYWQFVAVDTGHNDSDPATVATNITGLLTAGSWSEASWALEKIKQAGKRKTVLLSHHQLFSPFGSVGKNGGQDSAYNPSLLAIFQPVLENIEWWFWGHEHTLAIYDEYLGLKRGRCVGASAVPVFTDQQKYAPGAGLQTSMGAALPTWNAKGVLGNNGTQYDNCFAIMTLDGAAASVDYYTVPILQKAVRLDVADVLS